MQRKGCKGRNAEKGMKRKEYSGRRGGRGMDEGEEIQEEGREREGEEGKG